MLLCYYAINESAQLIIDRGFPFTWSSHCGSRDSRWTTSWSICGRYNIRKLIKINHKMSTVGFIVRYLELIFPHSADALNISALDNSLKRRDSSITYISFLSGCDLIQHFIMGRPTVYSNLSIGLDIDRQEDNIANAWVS